MSEKKSKITQDLYQRAMRFAGEKHASQKVPGTNANYLLHVSNVAMEVLLAYQNQENFDLDYAIQIAILHDTLEDTATDYDELKTIFGEKVAIAVKALTKDKTLPKRDSMQDSLKRIAPLKREVGIVKLADRITNLQSPPSHWDEKKIKRYAAEATQILEHLREKNEYLAVRLKQKIRDYEQYQI